MLSIFGTAILLYCTLVKFIFIAMGFKIRKSSIKFVTAALHFHMITHYFGLQVDRPLQVQVGIELGGTHCNLMTACVDCWLKFAMRTLQKPKKDFNDIGGTESHSLPRPMVAKKKKGKILWSCTFSAPEFTLVAYSLDGMPLYNVRILLSSQGDFPSFLLGVLSLFIFWFSHFQVDKHYIYLEVHTYCSLARMPPEGLDATFCLVHYESYRCCEYGVDANCFSCLFGTCGDYILNRCIY